MSSVPPLQVLVAAMQTLSSVTASRSGAPAMTSLSASARSSKATASKWCGSSSTVLLARQVLPRHRSKCSRRGMLVQARLGGRSMAACAGSGSFLKRSPNKMQPLPWQPVQGVQHAPKHGRP